MNEAKTNGAPVRLPIVGAKLPTTQSASADVDVEAELRAFEESERERLGIKAERKQWADTMLRPEVKRKERQNITLLCGGLTAAQDFLVEGALKGQGYSVKHLDVPDNAALQVGKEFGNRGQCNPTYFTVGNLVKYLVDQRQKGLSDQEIIANNVFVTAGACGPCRFGMYVTEYRKALRDAGFDGFRVMLFQQQGGLSQATGADLGIEFNPDFFKAIIKAIVCGDVLNAIGYRIRPYEVEAGATNRAMEEAKRLLYTALHDQTSIFVALWKARQLFAKVKVDRLRSKAKVSIIGEFWAMTTEGDGNYALQKFLESEGGECEIQLTTAWILYNIWQVARDTRVRAELRGTDGGKFGLEKLDEFGVGKRLAMMQLAEQGLRWGFKAFAWPAGLFDYYMADMEKVANFASDFYSNDLRGGEGHMEVGKLILNVVDNKCHMTLSVKPFGCMPSSGVSDGVQSLITAKFPGTIFCAVETSGDGAANFYSRVQMYMYKARIAAEEELNRVLKEEGLTIDEVRAFLDKHPKYATALHRSPHTDVAGTAAMLVREVAPYIKQTALGRAQTKAKRALAWLQQTAAELPGKAQAFVAWAQKPETHEQLKADWELVSELASGKAKERYAAFAQYLATRAFFENNREHQHQHEAPVAQAAAN